MAAVAATEGLRKVAWTVGGVASVVKIVGGGGNHDGGGQWWGWLAVGGSGGRA